MKLYRLPYSPYARKVQMLLDLLGTRYELVDVPYADRTEIARVSGGVMVPVLVDDNGRLVLDSRAICEYLLDGPNASPRAMRLVPAPWDGAIWAYADFCDGPLEDVLFRIASPAIRDAWQTPHERALYLFIKERKFGAGCVDTWERDRDDLVTRARRLLSPTLRTLAYRPFLFGDEPTLADAALYGNCAMLHEADPALLPMVAEELVRYMHRVEARAAAKARA